MKILCKYLRIYILFLILVLVIPLKISEKHSLVSIQNGSSEVILDCPYQLNKGDENGLVIKWFYEEEVTPAFQWIPTKQELPQDIGFLKGRIDVNHSVSAGQYSSHRALYILQPTLELSGLYTCYVSNFMEEDIAQIQLTVYIPPGNFTIDYYELEEDSVTFICQADGVYPEPEIEFYYENFPGPDITRIKDANVSLEFDNDTQTYNATMLKTFMLGELNISNALGCSLNIQMTDYKLDVGLTYFTGPVPSVSSRPDILPTTGDDFIEDKKTDENLGLIFDSSAYISGNGCLIIALLFSYCLLS